MGCFGDGGPEEPVDITKGGLVSWKKRSCTDVLCVGLFAVFLGIWITMAGVAFKNGDPSKMIFPSDSFGNLCGKDAGFENDKYVLYFDIAECMKGGVTAMMLNGGRCPTHQMCVDECPTDFWIYEVDAKPALMAYDEGYKSAPAEAFTDDSSTDLEKIAAQEISKVAFKAALALFGDEPDAWFSKLYCKPQNQATINKIKTGEIHGPEVLSTINDMMSFDECSTKQMPSSPIQNRCFPGSSDNTTVDDNKKSCENKKIRVAARMALTGRNDNATINATINDADCTMATVTVESGGFKEIMADLQQTWKLIAVMLSFSILISLIWILLLRFVGGKLVWGFIVGTNLLFLGGAYYSWREWERLKEVGVDLDVVTVVSGSLLQSSTTWLVLMIVFAVLFVVTFVVTLFMFNRIRIATTIMEEATKAVGAIPTTMIFPLSSAIMYLLVVYWYTSIAAYTATAARPVYRVLKKVEGNWENPMGNTFLSREPECNITEWNQSGQNLTDMANPITGNYTGDYTKEDIEDRNTICILDQYVDDYGWTNSTVIVQMVHIFGFYWSLNIVTGISQVTLAGCFASWYFARRKPKDIPQYALWLGFRNVFKHFGTIVFGAFIIALVQLLQTILNYVEKKTKRVQNGFIKCIIVCLKCCLWCMEKCLKYISQNAYIITAMYGHGFIKSACKAMKLIIMNAARAAAVTGVTNFVLLIGKLLISVGLALWSYHLFDNSSGKPNTMLSLVDNPELVKSTEMVVLLIFIGSYMIASGFFKVYAMAISTIFICFLEDLERNDGSAQKPYFMSKSLMKVMGKKNAAESTNTTEVSKVKKK